MIKKFIFGKVFDYAIQYIEENWDEIVAKGKEYAIQLLRTIRGKFIPEESLFSSQDAQLCNFDARLGEIMAQAEIESESGS